MTVSGLIKNMTKIAITGHTAGIGHSLYNRLIGQHNILGFSRSNGYDLSEKSTVNQIISASADVDIFVNNAYGNARQLDLGLQWANKNAHRSVLLINIGSLLCYVNDIEFPTNIKEYIKNKLLLRRMSYIVNQWNKSIQISLVELGFVATNFSTSKEFYSIVQNHLTDEHIIQPETAARRIEYVINQWIHGTHIPEMSVAFNHDKI